ncbi:patatin-like phospholipase family protein [Gemmata sp. JC717]|uniref:patatin-like phospholipase family protein n=1 Tax=Gemmata algarum TaxID=2975278 RepID=UPI0021BAA210|nr:patatin-like phospholipase family protein [Gemmata algarum]MDY3552361.1 patatin-like phospholipase family protein [Gemmata algarum]
MSAWLNRLPRWLVLLAAVAAATAAFLFTPLPGAVLYILMWLGTFPVTAAAVLAVLAVSWNLVGGGLGLNDLFWHRNRKVQLVTGLFAGLLIGQSVLIAFLLPKPPPPAVLGTFLKEQVPSLLPAPEYDPAEWVALGRWMALVYPTLLTLLLLPAVARPRTRFPLVLGALLSVAVFVGSAVALERVGLLGTVGGKEMFKETVESSGARAPGATRAYPMPHTPAAETGWRAWLRTHGAWLLEPVQDVRDPRLHALALVLAGALLFVLTGLAVCEWVARLPTPPPVLVLLVLLGGLNSVFGSLRFVFYDVPWELPVAAALALVLWGLIANSDDFKLRFPALEKRYRNLAPLVVPQPQPALTPPLLDSKAVLLAAQRNWNAASRPHTAPSLPPLVIVATSGGGSRAAVWTCAVLEELCRQELERRKAARVPEGGLLADQVRVVTGASGGMVGAAYHAAFYSQPCAPLPDGIKAALACRVGGQSVHLHAPLARALSRDNLSAVVATMLLSDLPSIWWPFPVNRDRGRSLELAFADNTRPAPVPGGPPPRSPFEFALSDLRTAEEEARVPSLIFSPMLVEDARRLLISNLDLAPLCRTDGPDGKVASFGAVEFYKLFPEARETFTVATAARMNASFPFVSPAVTLPTNPGRRVVDAGYYDNYGIDIAADWVCHHAKEIVAGFSSVLVLELRAYANNTERLNATAGEEPGPLGWLLSPLSAVLTMRERSPWYRNDERLRETGERFAAALGRGPGFVRTAALEFDGTAPLGWSMTDEQREQIVLAAQSEVNRLLTELERVYPWVPPSPPGANGATG